MKEQLPQNTIIKQKYQLVSKLKSGGFGSVYLAKSLQQKNKDVAIKVISVKLGLYGQIQRKMYSKIQDNKFTYGFIKNYDYFQHKQNIYLVLELLGKDLEDLMKKNANKMFSLKTVLMIGLQVVDRLQVFHKIGYLHRDIKPQNLLIGLKQKCKTIYLIDFGLAKPLDKQRPEQKGKILGSLAFMSCRAHQAKQLGPSDDLESLIYCMLFMIAGTLPWLKIKIHKIADAHKILLMKIKISKDNFQNVNIPQELFQILKQLRNLDVKQKPDYLKIKYIFLQLLKKKKLENDFQFDWCLKDNYKQKIENVPKKNIAQEKMEEQNQKIVQNQIYQIFKFMDKQEKQQKTQKSPKKNQKIQQIDSRKKIVKSSNQNRQKDKEKKILKEQKSNLIDKGKNKDKLQMMTQVELINSMKYSGPNIVINKTAKHKI